MAISGKHSGLLEKIVLISAPWPLFNRPSIQIGTLKSYLKSQFPDLKLESLGPQKTFFPTLPVELSRGCWWRKSRGTAGFAGCAFCNLNLQWEGYRSKNASETVSDIDKLVSKHKTLSVAFMDNMPPYSDRQ